MNSPPCQRWDCGTIAELDCSNHFGEFDECSVSNVEMI